MKTNKYLLTAFAAILVCSVYAQRNRTKNNIGITFTPQANFQKVGMDVDGELFYDEKYKTKGNFSIGAHFQHKLNKQSAFRINLGITKSGFTKESFHYMDPEFGYVNSPASIVSVTSLTSQLDYRYYFILNKKSHIFFNTGLTLGTPMSAKYETTNEVGESSTEKFENLEAFSSFTCAAQAGIGFTLWASKNLSFDINPYLAYGLTQNYTYQRTNFNLSLGMLLSASYNF